MANFIKINNIYEHSVQLEIFITVVLLVQYIYYK